MAQGPRTALQVTPQLLTPSQLMGAERAHRKAGLRGCSCLDALPWLTSGRLLGHPVTLTRSQGPRPGHMHISYPGRRLRFRAGHRPRVREVRHCLRMSAGTLVTQRACSLRGWKLPGCLSALSGRTRSGLGRRPVSRGRGGLRLLSELGHPEAALPGTLSVTGDSARSLNSASVRCDPVTCDRNLWTLDHC